MLAEISAVSIVGPRACGKTTTARLLAAETVRLDRPAEAASFRADPDVALRSVKRPALLDEWQEVPEVLGAVKRAVDDQPQPGSFILTGSVKADLDVAAWPATGRVVRTTMGPLTRREIEGRATGTTFLDRMESGALDDVRTDPLDLGDYVELATIGGFPEPALRLTGNTRLDWLESYVDQVVTRDAPAYGGVRELNRLRRYLEVEALNSAGVPTDVTLAEAAGIDRRTAAAYQQLLADLLVLDRVPAWATNRLSRLVKAPKRYLIDPSLIAGILRMDPSGILKDGDLLGRLLDTFVMSQVRAEVEVARSRPRLFHLRERGGGREVDLVVEYSGQRVAAIEVKASATPRRSDARHLEWLAERLGDRFTAGVVLHTGPRAIRWGDRIWALPISALWA